MIIREKLIKGEDKLITSNTKLKVITMVSISCILCLVSLLLIWRLPIYLTPHEIIEGENKINSPDNFLFYDNFVIFISIYNACLAYALIINKPIFKETCFNAAFFSIYWFIMFIFECTIIFNDLMPMRETLKLIIEKIFRIPLLISPL